MIHRWFFRGASLLIPLFICCVLIGCGEETAPQRRKGTGPDIQGSGGSGGTTDVPLTELATTGWGTIRGKIIYDGTPPTPTIIPAMLNNNDKNVCLAGEMKEKQDQTWIVGSDGGVANAVLWLEPPASKYFKIKDDLKKPANVKLQQPHCAFVAHVVALFPKYNDKVGLRPTGQRLEVINDSRVQHNFKIPGRNVNIPAGKSEFLDIPLSDEPVRAECSIHAWMSAYLWTFEHPYFAVTKDDGTFEIVVPAGVEIAVKGWHEGRPNWGELKKITVKDGESLDLGNIALK